MTLKEICIDCLCVQLYKIRENAEHPQKIISLVDELLAEYDNMPEQAPMLDTCQACGSTELIPLPDDERYFVCADCGTRK